MMTKTKTRHPIANTNVLKYFHLLKLELGLTSITSKLALPNMGGLFHADTQLYFCDNEESGPLN